MSANAHALMGRWWLRCCAYAQQHIPRLLPLANWARLLNCPTRALICPPLPF